MRLFTNTAPPTRLAGALSDSATTITVDSTDGWPTPTGADVALGCLTYPNADTLELFTYTGKTSTTFTGVVRGVDDTDPKAHLNRALVVHVASWTDLGGGGGGGASDAVDLAVDDAAFTVLTGTNGQAVFDSVDDVIAALPGPGATNAVDLVVDDAAFTVLTGTDGQAVLDSTDDYLAALVAGGVPVDDALFTRIAGTDVQATLDSVDDYLAAHPDVFANYIYNSSGAQSLNRFNDWADLMASIAAVEGAKVITFEQDETIPAGAWNLNDCTLRGNGSEYNVGGFTLTFPTGCTISSWRLARIESIRLLSTSSAPVMTWTTNQILQIASVSHVHSTTVPFFLGTAGTQHLFDLTNSGRFRKLAGGVENYDNTAPAFSTQLIINRGDNSSVDADTLKSTNAVIYVDIVADPANDVSSFAWPQTHTNLNVGVAVPLMFPRADATLFTAAGSIAATTVQAAIEELDGDLTALPTLDSGTYTPSATNVANVSSSSPQTARWVRVGDQVTVYGRISIDPITTATSTRVRVSLPVASNLGSSNDLAGVCVGDLSDESAGHIVADTANDEAIIEAYPVSILQHTYAYSYSYTVI